jgi:hypothetical protein
MTTAPNIGLAVNRALGQAPLPPWSDPNLSLLDEDIIRPPPFPSVLPAGWVKWTVDAAESAGCPVDYVALPLLVSCCRRIDRQCALGATVGGLA